MMENEYFRNHGKSWRAPFGVYQMAEDDVFEPLQKRRMQIALLKCCLMYQIPSQSHMTEQLALNCWLDQYSQGIGAEFCYSSQIV